MSSFDMVAVWTKAAEADAAQGARLRQIMTRPAAAPQPVAQPALVAQVDDLPRRWVLIGAPLWQITPPEAIEERGDGSRFKRQTGQPAWLKPIPQKPQSKRRLTWAEREAVLSVGMKDRGSPESYAAARAAARNATPKRKPPPPKRKPKAAPVTAGTEQHETEQR